MMISGFHNNTNNTRKSIYIYIYITFSALLHTSVSQPACETELEVQIILSACPCPWSPVLIPLSSLLFHLFPLLLLPPFNFPLHSVLDTFCLYHKHHLICFGKHIVHNWRALIDLYNVITPFSNVS